jgi:hypothetical protein
MVTPSGARRGRAFAIAALKDFFLRLPQSVTKWREVLFVMTFRLLSENIYEKQEDV